MQVIKTLVIGLGSSGLEVCSFLADRIRWELGSVQRAPWVRFLGIETNNAARSPLADMGDLLILNISSDEYSAVLNGNPAYDERYRLSAWIDPDTLRQIPQSDVSGGAGNIRMVGRLVLFLRHDDLRRGISIRLNDLRRLTPADAMERRGPLPSGENPEIVFSAGGKVRVFVVGTLCGGTCSGMAADFGLLLRTILSPDEKTIAMFTLPPRTLTQSDVEHANRYKKNAYTALMELNHYYLSGRESDPPVQFPDTQPIGANEVPYDLPFLLAPRGITRGEDVKDLHQMMSDYIFLNIFAPGAEPFAAVVDIPIVRSDKFHRAHAFSSMGIATIEYPAERIIEGCTYRQLAYTLGEWARRSLPKEKADPIVRSLGIDWELLRTWLFRAPNNRNLTEITDEYAGNLLKLVEEGQITQARSNLKVLRQAFEEGGAGFTIPDQIISPGGLYAVCRQNREFVLKQFRERLHKVVRENLLKYEYGPVALRDLMTHTIDALRKLSGYKPPAIQDRSKNTDAALSELEKLLQQRPGFFGRRDHEGKVKKAREGFREALNQEVRSWRDKLTWRGLSDSPSLIEEFIKEAEILQRRLNHLVQRVLRLQLQYEGEYNHRSREEPQVAGLALFRTGMEGTVAQEYERCLEMEGGQGNYLIAREKLAQEILQNWRDLLNWVAPEGQLLPKEDWLYQPYQPQRDEPFPLHILQPIVDVARRPFLQILQSDVSEKWWEFYPDRVARAEAASSVYSQVEPSLRVDRAIAERGRGPIPVRSVVAIPPSARHREDLYGAIASAPNFPKANTREIDSPYAYRAFVLQEWHRWPLNGVPDIVAPGGLCDAESNEFRTFHTRKDIAWTPLTELEVTRIDKALELLTLGVLCRIVRPVQGKLEVKTGQQAPWGEVVWKLPLRLSDAARRIAIARLDEDNNSLINANETLSQRIESFRKQQGSPDAFVDLLVERLRSGEASVIPDWNRRRAGNIVALYCFNHEELARALMQKFPPPSDLRTRLWREKGDSRPNNDGTFPEAGYYCDICGGWIGKDDEEALHNGWACYINPEEHRFYQIPL